MDQKIVSHKGWSRRLAVESDLTHVFDIYMRPSVIPYLGFDPMPLEEFRRQVFDDLIRSGCFFIIEHNDTVAGFLKVSRYPGRANHVAYIGSFAIHPDLHGAGAAKSIMEDVIANLQADGVKRIELIVESDNPKAITFYQKLGFNLEGTLRKFYKRADQNHYVDDHLMSRLFE